MIRVNGGIEVSLTDFDVDRFDPTVRRDIDVDAPLAERTPGGLGVYLVLKMVDSIHYEYHDRQSKITFQIKGGSRDV
jgi:anti-sigma regulatory factor (Ser/Thr protein kinase)